MRARKRGLSTRNGLELFGGTARVGPRSYAGGVAAANSRADHPAVGTRASGCRCKQRTGQPCSTCKIRSQSGLNRRVESSRRRFSKAVRYSGMLSAGASLSGARPSQSGTYSGVWNSRRPDSLNTTMPAPDFPDDAEASPMRRLPLSLLPRRVTSAPPCRITAIMLDTHTIATKRNRHSIRSSRARRTSYSCLRHREHLPHLSGVLSGIGARCCASCQAALTP